MRPRRSGGARLLPVAITGVLAACGGEEKAPSPIAGATPPPATVPEARSTYDVVLTSAGASKILVIKAIREITGHGLKDAKDIADGAASAPRTIKSGLSRADADAAARLLRDAGATVEIR